MLQPTSLSGASGVYVKPNENEYWAPDESSQTANRLHIGYVLTDLLNNSLNDIAASKTSKTSKTSKIENWDDLSSSDYTTILHNASEETFIHMVCRSLLHDQCLTKSDQLTNMFLSFESTDNPNIYTIPAKKEDPPIGLLLNLSVVDEPIMTMYIPGMPKVALSVTLTGDKPHCKLLRKYIDKVPDWVAQITAWRAWAKVNAPGEYRAEALSRVKAYIYNRACNRASALELELANLMLTSLPELPAGLKHLNVGGNNLFMSTGLELPTGLEELDVRRNGLDSLPILPAGLKHLYLCKNHLCSLPVLPASLEKLDVSRNRLCSLPVLPTGLVMLDVSNNQLSGLPALPAGLVTLDVRFNLMSSLPELPGYMRTLNVSNNQLIHLPVLPVRLKVLDVSNNQLTSLPDRLPSGLEMLNVCWNNLTSKPSLPPSRPNAWYFGCTINYEPQRPRSRENPSAEVSGYTP
ncbi:hypothetical protein ACT7KD_003858 [Escherichia coli]|uniref:hypothetical protein n=1 Tax=Escherichia TaxID=561 RepID=UPI0002BC00E9|nr:MULTISPECIES: hypothetical protein [Escherichia]EIZ7754015.1 hypothetical protein [Escherichia coli]EJF4667843.1 hypothetical protein [Escherichia coli]EKY6473380.1 hypothetical protein [Escherichia coli]ELJ1591537.1 hypothetical protein [Escherichia coli]MBB2229243.1 hypothetical protein [Escherichia sp. 79.0191]